MPQTPAQNRFTLANITRNSFVGPDIFLGGLSWRWGVVMCPSLGVFVSEVVTLKVLVAELDALEAGEAVTFRRERIPVSWGGKVIVYTKPFGDTEKRTCLCFVSHVPYGDEHRSFTLRRVRPRS